MNTVLVTGASGFIGRFLIHALLSKGDRVYALLRRPEQQYPELQAWLHQHGIDDHGLLQPIHGDLSQPDLAISAADWQAMHRVTVIYHSGAVMAWGMTAAHARLTNVTGSTQLLRLAHQHLHLERFVQLSGFMLTIAAHLRSLGISSDGTADWPAVYRQVGAYEASKFESHYAVKQLAQQLAIPLTVIHPSLVIGHSHSGEISTTQDFAKTIANLLRRKLPVAPKGSLPMIAVDELTAFMAHVVDVPESAGMEYVMANRETLPLIEALSVCAQTAGVPAPYGTLPVGFFKALGRSRWLARLLDIEPETLNFIRHESLDTTASHAMQQRLGLAESPLTDTLARTTRYLHMHQFSPVAAGAEVAILPQVS